MAGPRISTFKIRVRQIRAVQHFEQLAALLRCPVFSLLALVNHPGYRTFRIPKKKGGLRVIEDPVPGLKKVQRRLNDYLQAVYYFHRTTAAYGFVAQPANDPDPRNILTNAQQHLAGKYLLNVDLKDFFHSITNLQVQQLFASPIFGFDEELAKVLAKLCCYRGRLPMGAPTSPVISNLVSISLDQKLLAYSEEQHWCYTRYADDMSFSSPSPILPKHLQAITDCITQMGFQVNPNKVKQFGPKDKIREVTGLGLKDGAVVLSANYLSLLAQAICRLDEVMDAKFGTTSGKDRNTPWVKELQQQVRGKLAFAQQILGAEHSDYERLEEQYWRALEPPIHYGPLTWLAFGYDGIK